MRKIILTEWVTLDGFVSDRKDIPSFVSSYFNDEMSMYEDVIVSSADTLMLGRKTYESFAGSWPHVPGRPGVSEGEKEYAKKLNAMKKVVFSKTLDKVEWNNSQLYNEIDAEEIKKLKEQPGEDILIYGSTSIVQALTNLGLLDEYQVLIHPILIGEGKPLFKNIKDTVKLKLVDSITHATDVIRLTYQLEK
ncbi:MAG: dihydrofolate reductase family protein [bacterium]|nr:dihydrofolate reductase family protein [bacterium]